MTSRPAEAAMGPCLIHGGMFVFNPYKVTVVLIDPVTRKPPDVDPDPGTPDLDARMARSVQRVICPDCCSRLNVEAGFEKFPLLDDGLQVID